LTGLAWPIQQRVTITDTNNETVVVTVSATSVPAIRTVTRQNLSLDTIETTAYIGDYPVYSVDGGDITNFYSYTYDETCSIVRQAPPNNAPAILSLNPTFEVATHFVQLKVRLTQELIGLCPDKPIKAKNSRYCCEPSACKADAEALADIYVAALENAWMQRELGFGGSLGNFFLWFYKTDWTGENYPEDLFPGLVCGGWYDMAQVVLGLPTENSDCWNVGAETSRNWFMRLRKMDGHIWAILYVKCKDESVSLDPWPSGGWEY